MHEMDGEGFLSTRSAIRKKLKQMQTYSLGLIANEINSSETKGDIITHATDSATRMHVGTFAPSGLHINRDIYFASSHFANNLRNH